MLFKVSLGDTRPTTNASATPIYQVRGNRRAETPLERCLVTLGRWRDSFSQLYKVVGQSIKGIDTS